MYFMIGGDESRAIMVSNDRKLLMVSEAHQTPNTLYSTPSLNWELILYAVPVTQKCLQCNYNNYN